MFTITIQQPTAEEAIAELFRAARFYQERPNLAGNAAALADAPLAGETPAEPAKRKPRAAKAAEPANTPEPPAAESSAIGGDPAPAADEKPASPEALLAQFREAATPLMKDPVKGPQVSQVIASYGAKRVSEIPADKLPEAIARVKEL